MISKKLVASFIVVSALVALPLGLGACGDSDTESSTKSPAAAIADFELQSAAPVISSVDVGATGPSVGDTEVFTAAISKDGQAFGTLVGTKLLLELGGQDSIPSGLGLFQNQLTFRLPGGDIAVVGLQQFPLDTSDTAAFAEMAKTATVRVISGGTGDYVGARGELTSVPQPNGGRLQKFHFVP
jgi:hypothetical protein